MEKIARYFLILALAALLPACATLRTDAPRVASHALAPDPQTPLGQIAGRLLDPAQASSFRLLESGRAALAARLALANRANKTLDLQYYLFHSDTSGRVLVDALLQAADRGVRVRVLLDDVDTAGRGWRHGEDFATAIGSAQGFTFDDVVGAQIVDRHSPASSANGGHDAFCDGTIIERARSMLRYSLQR